MGPFQWFLFVYVLGGLTFIPLTIVSIFAFIFYTSGPPRSLESLKDDPAQLLRSDDEKVVLKTATDDLAEKFHRKHETDVAAGYFAVCREYVPGGANGKPPEKLTPAGEVVAQESPSVYQSMYRSIFDRTQKPTIEASKDSSGKVSKKANNIFYVVLRHNHLMLYDDIQQLEVRYVISLEYHDVDVYGGGEKIPEGELWIKRNSIRLKRKPLQVGDKATSRPFFLFSENLSDKEDFYFALLKNQQNSTSNDIPTPEQFDVRHIVDLVQKLHSSEEHLQTRWLNALVGRIFLAMYKTPILENIVRQKLTKKISRVKKPAFITKLILQKIDAGVSAPFVTNPRLKDFTVNGDLIIEMDVDYTGMFRIEIAAMARLELGSRFKAREVDIVLAATCKKMSGHVLVRIKPPPSNRLWFTFEKVPQLDLQLEPIISSRQITYNVILRAMESRIREVIAETVCLPFWDDIPFYDTSNEDFRGGIWKKAQMPVNNTEIKDEVVEDEAEAGGSGASTPDLQHLKNKDERTMSTPVLADTNTARKGSGSRKSATSFDEILGPMTQNNDYNTTPPNSPPPPRLLRTASLASAADPMVTTNSFDGDALAKESTSTGYSAEVTNMLKDITRRSTNGSAIGSQSGSPPKDPSPLAGTGSRTPSLISKASTDSNVHGETDHTSSVPSSIGDGLVGDRKDGTVDSRTLSLQEDTGRGFSTSSRTGIDKKATIASINAAAAAAQKWGWGVLAKARQKDSDQAGNMGTNDFRPAIPTEPMGRGRPLPPPGTPLPPPSALAAERTQIPTEPMGRGRPLPPPGIPLPPPDRKNGQMPKRKAVPPPLLPKRNESNEGADGTTPQTTPRPALPERRDRRSSIQTQDQNDDLLVVEAPDESNPTSPVSNGSKVSLPIADVHHDEFFGHHEGEEELKQEITVTRNRSPAPPLPRRNDFDEGQGMPEGEHALSSGKVDAAETSTLHVPASLNPHQAQIIGSE